MKPFSRRKLLAAFAAAPLALRAQPQSLRGRLRAGPRIETAERRMVEPTGDAPTRGVLNDARLLGFDMELLGRFKSEAAFTVDPIHTRSIFVYENGKRLMVTYWCEVCSLRTYTPGVCWCCQQETELSLREKDDIL